MSGPADLTLAEASREIAAGRLSPLELAEACLRRLEGTEPAVRAFVLVDPEGVLRAARALTEELARRGRRGPLHGIPLGVKDVIDVAGFPTLAGSRVLDPVPADRDAPVVERLRAAGGVVVGKTTTHEFAHGVETPPTRNPWDPSRIPGGSSGGSAAAVAVGSCLGALGSDSGGSVRVPAALCGVSGLRPLPGTVPLGGVLPFSVSHDTVGPLARTAEDLALLSSGISGTPPELGPATPDRLRFGVPERPSGSPAVLEAVSAAATVLTDAGARIVSVTLPPFEAWEEPRTKVVMAEFLDAHRKAGWYPARAERYGEDVRAYLERAERMPPREVAAARERLAELVDRFRSALDPVDVLLLPTTPTTAPSAEPTSGSGEATLRRSVVQELIRLTAPVGTCGLAAVSVPCGADPAGLPIGLQLVGRDERIVLAVAQLYQRLTDHHRARPPG